MVQLKDDRSRNAIETTVKCARFIACILVTVLIFLYLAYKVQVKRILTKNTWLKIRCEIKEVNVLT